MQHVVAHIIRGQRQRCAQAIEYEKCRTLEEQARSEYDHVPPSETNWIDASDERWCRGHACATTSTRRGPRDDTTTPSPNASTPIANVVNHTIVTVSGLKRSRWRAEAIRTSAQRASEAMRKSRIARRSVSRAASAAPTANVRMTHAYNCPATGGNAHGQ